MPKDKYHGYKDQKVAQGTPPQRSGSAGGQADPSIEIISGEVIPQSGSAQESGIRGEREKVEPQVSEEEPMQKIPLADLSGEAWVFPNRVEIHRHPPPPPEEPKPLKLSAKTLAEIEGGKAAVQRHKDRLEWAKNFEAKRQKLPSELMGELNEAKAEGFNKQVDLNPGGMLIGRHTAEGDPKKDADPFTSSTHPGKHGALLAKG